MIAIDAKYPECCANCVFCDNFYCALYRKQIGKDVLDIHRKGKPYFCKILDVLCLEEKKLIHLDDIEKNYDKNAIAQYIKREIASSFAKMLTNDWRFPFHVYWVPELKCLEVTATADVVYTKDTVDYDMPDSCREFQDELNKIM